MKNLIKFKISDAQYLKINPENISTDECKLCANIDIDYIDEQKNIILRFGYEHYSSFCYKIAEYGFVQKLINSEMILDDNSAKILGVEWNQYFERVIKDTNVDQYLCWSNSHKQIRPYFNSWMYNDQEGNVIFEITPFYPWHGETKKSNPDFISYKEFMKDYKPIIKTIIPKENLKQWIKQAEMLDKMLKCEDNQCD